MLEDEGVDATIERMAIALRRPEDLGPGIDRGVMAAIRAAPLMVAAAPRVSRAPSKWAWLVRPRPVRFSVSPLGALAAAGIAIVAALFGLRREQPSVRVAEDLRHTGEFPRATGEFPAISKGKPAPDTVFVTKFYIVAPGAKQVALVGDFNDWDQAKTKLTPVKNGNGLWSIDVQLPPGVYSYAFLIDGEWKADPRAPRVAGDDFGRPSSIVTVAREGMST
ncbi:glycoside hydrolase family 13 domain protein [Gemmatirosa kalamazoonensis]|uniref:Glycoside hydrolase family 13 domain protein n=1 Tax=Gemmatirosa kalamazoonensis TaxID=861299 RepID=W0RNK2_9BACT|nr:isoamylase early set domain-containing protein [Gemmatirosa kalamazoonensis]AHG92077.1 glycoside hydrolase family 13 domain protein [Gemmatirosa kalamazoonensis]